MAEKKFSELPSAASLTGNELAALSQTQSGSLASVKSTLQAIANWFAVYAQYTTALQTTDKSIAGAINELKSLIALIPGFNIVKVNSLPTEDIDTHTLYLVPSQDPEAQNSCDEYINTDGTTAGWELIGSTDIDLSDYYTKLEVDAMFSELATVATSGSYNDLTNKPDLSALMDVNETTFTNPYTKKIVPSGKFTEKLKKLIGASVVWNQLAKAFTDGNLPSSSLDNWYATTGTATASSGICTLTPSAQYGRINQYIPYVANHKILIKVDVKLSNSTNADLVNAAAYGLDTVAGGIARTRCAATTEWQTISFICYSTTSSVNNRLLITDTRTSDWGTIQVKNYVCHDLTSMFGATIADYVYTLEAQTAGSGVAWLKSYGFFTEEYYAYSENTIQSVSVSGKKNVGANLLGGNFLAESICSVIPNATKDTTNKTVSFGAAQASRRIIFNTIFKEKTSYTVILKGSNSTANQNTNLEVRFTDESFATIQFPTSTAGAIQTAVLVTNANKSVKEIIGANFGGQTTLYYEECGMFEGILTADDFEPYEEITTELDHTELHGVFRLDANNNIVADGDEYNADGSGEKKYYLGTIAEITSGKTWTRAETATSGVYRWSCQIVPASKPTASQIDGFLCEDFTNAKADDIYRGLVADKSVGFNSTNLYVIYLRYDSATTQEELLNAVGANAILYELSTPTTATLTPYEKIQVIEQGGTEEFIDYGVEQGTRDVAIPAGNETAYGDNELMGKVINYINT